MRTSHLLSALAVSLTTMLGAYSAHACATNVTDANNKFASYKTANSWIGSETVSADPVTSGTTTTGWFSVWAGTGGSGTVQLYIPVCSSTIGVHSVHGLILGDYHSQGDIQTSPFGWPVADEQETPDGDGRVSFFQSGGIYFNSATSQVGSVHGFNWDLYFNVNFGDTTLSGLGFPVGDEGAGPFTGWRKNVFQNGVVLFNPGASPLNWQTASFPVFSNYVSAIDNISTAVLNDFSASATDCGGCSILTVAVNNMTPNHNFSLLVNNLNGSNGFTITTNSSGSHSATFNLTNADASFCDSGHAVFTLELTDGSGADMLAIPVYGGAC